MLYAEIPSYRARQLLLDGLVIAWVAAWAGIGSAIYSLVEKLIAPGRLIEGAGSDLASGAGRARANIEGIPLIGNALRTPFDNIERVGGLLTQAGRDQQEIVHTLALWLGILLAALPIGIVLYHWLGHRWRWVREASAANLIRGDAADLQLFALRALATRPLAELRRATPDPAGSYTSGDYGRLAAVELGELGLRAARRGKLT